MAWIDDETAKAVLAAVGKERGGKPKSLPVRIVIACVLELDADQLADIQSVIDACREYGSADILEVTVRQENGGGNG